MAEVTCGLGLLALAVASSDHDIGMRNRGGWVGSVGEMCVPKDPCLFTGRPIPSARILHG